MGWHKAGGACSCCLCECSCEHCSNGQAPCCWKVVLSGIKEGTCGYCTDYNRTYLLEQDTDDDCHWYGYIQYPCPECEPTQIDLYVTYNGTYKIRIELGDHVWEKDYGASKPVCCKMSNENIPYSTGTGTGTGAADCDGSLSICVISDSADCPAYTTICGDCINECYSPQGIVLDIPANNMDNKAVCIYYQSCGCNTISGLWAIPSWDPSGPTCRFIYSNNEYCLIAAGIHARLSIDVRLEIADPLGAYWWARIDINALCGAGFIAGRWARWESAKHSYPPDTACPWRDPATGRIPLIFHSNGIDDADYCVDSWPGSIDLLL